MINDVFRVLNSKNSVSSDLLSMLRSRQKSITDIIDMNEQLREKMLKTVFKYYDGKEMMYEDKLIPADIFIADTVPLRSFTITGYDEGGCHYENKFTIFDKDHQFPIRYMTTDENGMIDPYSMQILDPNDVDISEHLQRDDSELVIGTVQIIEDMLDSDNTHSGRRGGYVTYSFPLMLYKDTVSLTSILYDFKFVDEIRRESKSVYLDTDKDVVDLSVDVIGDNTGVHLIHALTQALTVLYAIECFLLNPIVMDVFKRNSTPTPIDINKHSRSAKKQKIKYVKRHIINADEIDRAFEKRGFVRKAMIWYVTGHWREYKSGKRIFVQGYWKGALRHSKDTTFKNLEPREREMVIPENKEEMYNVKTT